MTGVIRFSDFTLNADARELLDGRPINRPIRQESLLGQWKDHRRRGLGHTLRQVGCQRANIASAG
jgi:hypothetical protein